MPRSATAEHRAAIDRYLLLAWRSAANRSSGVRQANDGTDGQTDGRPTVA